MQMDAEKIIDFSGCHQELGKDLLACSVPQGHPSSEAALCRSINAEVLMQKYECIPFSLWL